MDFTNLNCNDNDFFSQLTALEPIDCQNNFEEIKMCVKGKILKSLEHQWKQPLNYISTNLLNLEIQAELNQLNVKTINEFNQNIEKAIQRISNDISFYNKLFQTSTSKSQFQLNDIVDNYFNIIQHKIRNNDIEFNFVSLKQNEETLYNYESENALLIILFLYVLTDFIIKKNLSNMMIHVEYEKGYLKFLLNQSLDTKNLLQHYSIEWYLIKLLLQKTSMSLMQFEDEKEVYFLLNDKESA